ncbi:MAG: PEP-CTERM sorting domain-containing protein, partial [Burkholderiaceae bacterium]|nr:PEP-CTERM sorting domain-containing protein [Burkholderiaceae bacterium]
LLPLSHQEIILKQLKLATLIAVAFASAPALAHITYTDRNFGGFSGLALQSASITNQAVSGNFGWADATDDDFGDSHKGRSFRFNLQNEANVSILATANATATVSSIDGLLPGFSVYSGLVHLPPAGADYDGSDVSQAYLATLPGPTKEGVWRSLADWKVGNEDGTTFADLSTLLFQGYAVDGSAANYGTAPGIVGDGVADGSVTGAFRLAAGDYTIFLGGADYDAQDVNNPDFSSSYGASLGLTVSAVPEPESYALMLAGLGVVGFGRAYRQRSNQR